MGGHSLRTYVTLAALPSTAYWSRRLVTDKLVTWNAAKLVDTVELLVSEVVTNAVKALGLDGGERDPNQGPVFIRYQTANCPCLRLRLTLEPARLIVEVWDPVPEPPVAKNVGDDAEGGRGLQLVETLSSAWGWYWTNGEHNPRGGKVVWFQCSLLT